MTMTNANKRQRPAEDREARRHLEPFEHWTGDDFKPIDEVEISDDGDDPAESGEVLKEAESIEAEVPKEELEEPAATLIAPIAEPEPTASPVIPVDVVLAEPTAAPVAAAADDENGAVLEPTAAPIVPSTAAPAPIVGEDEGNNAIAAEPTAADAEVPVTTATTDSTSTPEPTAAPTGPAPIPVTRETDGAGNTVLYSCADAAPILTDPATGATAPSYQSMVVEFDYELFYAGTQNLQGGNNPVLAAAINRIADTYLADLAEQYDLAGEDCAAIESAFNAAGGNNDGLSRKTMLRRTLMRKLQGETTVVEISDGGDVIDDVKCVTDAPSNDPSVSCVPVKAKVGVKYTGTDEASIRSAVFSTARSQVESLPADGSGKFVGITFVGQRVGESAGKDNLNPFPGNLGPSVAAAEEQQTNDPQDYAPVGITFMAALALAVLLIGLLVGRGIRNRTRRNKASKETTDKASKCKTKSKYLTDEEGSFAGIASVGSDSRIGIDRRSIDESGHIMVSSPATLAPTDLSGELDEVEVELNPDDLTAGPSKKRSRGLGIFRTRSRSKSPGRRSRSKSPVADEAGTDARSILDDLNQEENMAAAPPINRTSTNQSIEACLDYYNYDDNMIDSRGRSVTPTRSLMDDDEDVYGIVDLGN